jgi:hypothetical protein
VAAIPAVAGIAEHLAAGAILLQVVGDTRPVEDILPVADTPAASPRRPPRRPSTSVARFSE